MEGKVEDVGLGSKRGVGPIAGKCWKYLEGLVLAKGHEYLGWGAGIFPDVELMNQISQKSLKAR